MKFSFISLFPEVINATLSSGVFGQAVKKNKISFQVINPRQFTQDVHKTVDDVSYGGIDGMVMLAEVLDKSLGSIDKPEKVFYLSPQGKTFKHEQIQELLKQEHIVFICGRYAGVDQRFLAKHQIQEISIGDFVLSGGELAAIVIADSIARQVPGVLGNADSAVQDSFYHEILEAPCFTRPAQWQGFDVPEVLTSGNHKKIQEWRERVSILVTLKKRPDLLQKYFAKEFIEVPSYQKISWKQLEAFYQQISEKEKIVCGIENVVFPRP